MIVVENLSKIFPGGAAPAVNGVSFCAPSGAITSLVGPSGSGKSTILRLIAGLETPDQGTVSIDGQELTHVPVRERGVGFVFQSYALFPHMTVFENVAFGLRVRRAPRREVEQRVVELLQLVQMESLVRRYPGQLSGGQRQRVAFARALAVRPRVLLLDEPFGALDVRVRVELREWLQGLHDQTRVTTLLVTHDQDEALELSEHVVVMFEGNVAQAGSPTEIYDSPATPAVASFIGGANCFSGKASCGKACLGAFRIPLSDQVQDGRNVQAFVRSHDVRLSRGIETAGSSVAQGRVEKLRVVGGSVKATILLRTGESLSLDLSRTEVDSLAIHQGDDITVDILGAKVFTEDYQI